MTIDFIQGVITALISPFTEEGFDEKSFENLLNHQWDHGIRAVVINGTTAESPCLTKDEVKLQVEICRRLYPKMKIILGTGSNCTKAAIENNKFAESLSVDAVLSVVPYYNKPTQQGLYEHFKMIAKNTKLPVILYNVPGRTVAKLELETILQLSEVENIVGIKEATGEPDLIRSIKKGRPNFLVLSGDDGTHLSSALVGGDGVISVISHLIPSEFISLTENARNGESKSVEVFKKYMPLCNVLFTEPNPIPVKAALKRMNIIADDYLRLPLTRISTELDKSLEFEMEKVGLI